MSSGNKEAVFMEIASRLSQLGTCDRKQVGALIVRDGRCVSWGFNGAPPGLPHCAENKHGWLGNVTDEQIEALHMSGELCVGDSVSEAMTKRWGCRNATHAEANALAFAARQGISTDDATLFVTVSPCEVCARLLIAAGISHVYYNEEYRDRSGIELLSGALIPAQYLA